MHAAIGQIRREKGARGHAAAFEPAFDFGGSDYGRFFRSAVATAFQHPVWLTAFQRILAPARDAVAGALTLRDDDGVLLAVLPVTLRRTGGIRLLEAADLGVCDYCAPAVDASCGMDGAALGAAMAAALPGHDVLRIRNIRPEHAAFFEALSGATAHAAGFSAHATRLAASLPEWKAASLAPGFAKSFDRKLRKFAELPGTGIGIVAGPDDAAAAISTLADLRAGRFSGDMIAMPAICAFYQHVAREGAAAGFARTFHLSIASETIGVLFGIAHGGRFNYLLIGCDYANHGRLSPGMVLYDHAIGASIAAGDAVFDFTIGDEPFKRDLGTAPTPMVSIESAQNLAGRAALMALGLRARLAAGTSQ
jgi:CelD/BcsL family acetyltransferase involved in cellulose biosynthesis